MSNNERLKVLDGILKILKENNRIRIEECDKNLIEEFEKRKLVLVLKENGKRYLEITQAGRTYDGFEKEAGRIEAENEDKELSRNVNLAMVKSSIWQKWYVYVAIASLILSVIIFFKNVL